jgi:hypothetical protein
MPSLSKGPPAPPRLVGISKPSTSWHSVQRQLEPVKTAWDEHFTKGRYGIRGYWEAVRKLGRRWTKAGVMETNIGVILENCKKPNRPRFAKPYQTIIWATSSADKNDRSKWGKLVEDVAEYGGGADVTTYIAANGGTINACLSKREKIRPYSRKRKSAKKRGRK